MKKRFSCLLFIVLLFSGCNLVDSFKWFIGAVDYGKIKGAVSDLDNLPIQGAGVLAYYPATGVVAGSDVTDSEGRYMLDELAPGVYRVALQNIGYDFQNVDNVTVTAAEVTRIDFEDVLRVDVNNWYSYEDANPYGKTIDNEYYAQSFKPNAVSLRGIACYIFGSANDFRIELRSDNSGEPSATNILASGDAGVSTNVAKVYFDSVTVTPGAVYWIVIFTTSANYHFLAVDKYAGGTLKYSTDGTAWSDPGATEKDMTFTTFY